MNPVSAEIKRRMEENCTVKKKSKCFTSLFVNLVERNINKGKCFPSVFVNLM